MTPALGQHQCYWLFEVVFKHFVQAGPIRTVRVFPLRTISYTNKQTNITCCSAVMWYVWYVISCCGMWLSREFIASCYAIFTHLCYKEDFYLQKVRTQKLLYVYSSEYSVNILCKYEGKKWRCIVHLFAFLENTCVLSNQSSCRIYPVILLIVGDIPGAFTMVYIGIWYHPHPDTHLKLWYLNI